MIEPPTFQEFLDDLVRSLCALPYAVECIRIQPEGRITIHCKEGTLLLKASIQPSQLVEQGSK
jgi:hypothetical protein